MARSNVQTLIGLFASTLVSVVRAADGVRAADVLHDDHFEPAPAQPDVEYKKNLDERAAILSQKEEELRRREKEIEEGLEILKSSYVRDNQYHKEKLEQFEAGDIKLEEYERETSHIIR